MSLKKASLLMLLELLTVQDTIWPTCNLPGFVYRGVPVI